MDTLQSFSDSLTELERILRSMADVSKRTDGAWKKEFIELRRRLQAQISTVAVAADQCERIKRNADLTAQLRQALARMRSMLALHQASWPAVTIDASNPGYIDSVSRTRATNWAFVELARKAIAEARQPSPVTVASQYIDAAAVEALLNPAGRP